MSTVTKRIQDDDDDDDNNNNKSQAERQFKPCVNGDISFLWESQKFDPHRMETPNLIEIKFGTVDYVGEMTPSAKFN